MKVILMNIESRVLTGVVIDPGHGGDDPGATGNNKYEKDYTLKYLNICMID